MGVGAARLRVSWQHARCQVMRGLASLPPTCVPLCDAEKGQCPCYLSCMQTHNIADRPLHTVLTHRHNDLTRTKAKISNLA